MKYVLVSGGVISGIGKGVIASSTGLLLQTIGLKVSSIKIDPYMNVDAGTMAPKEHGECFVLDDGGEVDLDLGNYERYLNVKLRRDNNITTGKIFLHVINKEREGGYLGRTVQVVPHVTDAIADWIERVSRIPIDGTGEQPDVCIIELGGTVGDIEGGPFIEAMRTLRRRAGKNNFLQAHVSLVPVISGEQKTKPTQQAIKEVRSAGLSPDLIACRCTDKLEEETVKKIAHYCQVDYEQVVAVHNVASTYHVPLLLEQQGMIAALTDILQLSDITVDAKHLAHGRATWKQWKALTQAQDRLFDTVTVALVGKYTNLHDSYLSVIKSLEHAAMHCHRKLELIWVDAEHLEQHMSHKDPAKFHKAWHQTCTAEGILVPGGFGLRGTEGMISAAKWARENKKPYLGICLGMQLAVVEYARSVCGLDQATSKEFRTDKGISDEENIDAEVIVPMEDIDQKVKGGTMRLGLHPTVFQPGSETSILRRLYQDSRQAQDTGTDTDINADEKEALSQISLATTTSNAGAETSPLPARILERHRHRFEVNPEYVALLTSKGLQFTGKDVAGKRMEICELRREDHPFYVGVQFHPEYLSRVLEPSRPYMGFVAASAGELDNMLQQVAEGHGNIELDGIAEEMPRRRTLSGANVPAIGNGHHSHHESGPVNGNA